MRKTMSCLVMSIVLSASRIKVPETFVKHR